MNTKTLELLITSAKTNHHQVECFIAKLVEEFKVPESLYVKLTLSVIEAVNNAMIHANKFDPSKFIRISATKEEKMIIVIVEDEGEGFDFNNILDPTILDNLMKTSGRGLFLISRLTDKLSFENNGTKVIMTFLLN